MNEHILRFSSINDFFNKKTSSLTYKMKAFYTDTYKVSFKKLKSVVIIDENSNVLIDTNNDFEIKLNKDQIIFVTLNKDKSLKATIKVTALAHKSVSPYEPVNLIDSKTFKKHGDDNVDPLTPCVINCQKRNDGNGLYINCNNPEKLTQDDVGKALSRVNISNKKVFFTFEHNNLDTPFYYGYQVKNTSNEDIYVTVLNMGFQLDGLGCWLGEKEWVDFYNVNFRYDTSHLTLKQKETFIDYFNFSNKYKTKNNQPTTYRIPKGKYIYVMGGTTKDAYKHINVWKSADKKVCNGCSNGAVLFDVIGKAEGSFFIYTDINQIKNNNTHQGYVLNRNGKDYGTQYVGYDTCHGVVDTHITYTFNDLTPSQDLPVEYVNYYSDEEIKKIPYMKVNVTAHLQKRRNWVTHIHPQGAHEGVGSDMTRYITINENKEEICIDSVHLDGNGNISNIGNWMMDYMDYFTFVNKGNTDRFITINMKNTGSLCVLIKDKNGKLVKSSPMFTIMQKVDKGEEYHIQDDFTYTVKIKPHSVKQFIVEYNLLANSCGYVTHKVTLK